MYTISAYSVEGGGGFSVEVCSPRASSAYTTPFLSSDRGCNEKICDFKKRLLYLFLVVIVLEIHVLIVTVIL